MGRPREWRRGGPGGRDSEHEWFIDQLDDLSTVARRRQAETLRFDVDKLDLLDLWRTLERRGVTYATTPLHECVEGGYVEVRIRGDEAEVVPPCWLPPELREVLDEMVVAYRTHVDWRRHVEEDYRLWLESISRFWGLPEEERRRRVERLLRRLTREVGEEAESLRRSFEALARLWRERYERLRMGEEL